MTNQTENYLLLKPLSERVNRICLNMSDSEIKELIKSAMKEQIRDSLVDMKYNISSFAENIVDSNYDAISMMVKESIASALHLDSSWKYEWKNF